jgi:hypothetical protein
VSLAHIETFSHCKEDNEKLKTLKSLRDLCPMVTRHALQAILSRTQQPKTRPPVASVRDPEETWLMAPVTTRPAGDDVDWWSLRVGSPNGPRPSPSEIPGPD